MASVNKKHRALYYPFIEVRDPTWLLGATLFWDEISTITPNVAHPYTSRVSHELYEEGVLKPYRSNPQRREIVSISEKISEFITNPHFKSLIGLDHWSVQLSN